MLLFLPSLAVGYPCGSLNYAVILTRLRGGHGIAASIGVYGWFVPPELSAAMVFGALLVVVFVHNVEHRLDPPTPIAFVSLMILWLNRSFMRERFGEFRGSRTAGWEEK